MKIAAIVFFCLIVLVLLVKQWTVGILKQTERDNRLRRGEHLTDPTVCRGCGHKHPMVADIGCCGSCASKTYGDGPYLNEK